MLHEAAVLAALIPSSMARRQHLTLLVALAIATFLSISYLFGGGNRELSLMQQGAKDGTSSAAASTGDLVGEVPNSILSGGSIAPKLKNETAKYVHLERPSPRSSSNYAASPRDGS